jgi:hypothetical protein
MSAAVKRRLYHVECPPLAFSHQFGVLSERCLLDLYCDIPCLDENNQSAVALLMTRSFNDCSFLTRYTALPYRPEPR